jgi:UDP-glucose 4-epimerase
MKPKIVILGNGGLIGAALEKEFKKKRSLQVEGFNSSSLDLSLKKSSKQLAEILNEETILLVLARSRTKQNEIDTFHHSTLINQNIARCLEKKRIKKCLYFSSISVYGETTTNRKITENTPVDPSTLYGASKFAGEKLLQLSAYHAGFPLLVLRCCKVYGPGNPDIYSYGPDQFMNTILQENRVALFGNGADNRDYLFIQDLIGIIKYLIFSKAEGTLNLASGDSNPFNEIASLLRKVTRRDFDKVSLDRKRPLIHQGFNIKKLLNACPDASFTDLARGLKRTWDFMSK